MNFLSRLENLPWWFSDKESSCQCRDTRDSGSIPGSGRSLDAGDGNLLHYSCLGNPMEEPGRLLSMGSQRVRRDLAIKQQQSRLEKSLNF